MAVFTQTGEGHRGRPVVTLGGPDLAAARGRRERAFKAIIRAEASGQPVTPGVRAAADAAKAEVLRLTGLDRAATPRPSGWFELTEAGWVAVPPIDLKASKGVGVASKPGG